MSHPGLTLGGLSLLAAKWLAELRAAWPSHAEALKLALQRFFHQWRQDVQKLTARQSKHIPSTRISNWSCVIESERHLQLLEACLASACVEVILPAGHQVQPGQGHPLHLQRERHCTQRTVTSIRTQLSSAFRNLTKQSHCGPADELEMECVYCGALAEAVFSSIFTRLGGGTRIRRNRCWIAACFSSWHLQTGTRFVCAAGCAGAAGVCDAAQSDPDIGVARVPSLMW
ncbi:unnamed protein product [Durusdinium trenchii]|uniref:Uncharacterized protein n=1 Tax=Durusdinium trenchii TaxID=1381693 RepID=A0ABP0PQW2_9DINO